ncbi:chymotrypsin-2 [Drosophila eugracilis]|uniref:chymotrypsin-2 n=1 Tax=Drosophila eugracilis TaxID=29029 RepID=UPI001BDB479A|nr:chymotrypsin-2 [Drosophila eugracilis]
MYRWSYLCRISLFILLSAGHENVSDTPQISTTLATTTAIPYRSRYPYVVSIGVSIKGYYKHLCVGVIIADAFVLTAAHCIKTKQHQKSKMFVAAGDDLLKSRLQSQFAVVAKLSHPHFKILKGNDIALLMVTPKFPLDDIRFQSIKLLSRSQTSKDDNLSLLGWGRVTVGSKMNKLQEMPYEVMENDVCKKKHRFVFLTRTEFCATHLKGPRGACDGDSGGPLMNLAEHTLYGLLSYGRKACVPLQPYAFTRVSEYLNWIEESMNHLSRRHNVLKVNRRTRKDTTKFG